MVRDELTANSIQYSTVIRQSDFAQDSQWRSVKGGVSDSTSTNMNADQLGDIEIARIGNMLYTYYINFDSDRILYDSREIVMDDPVYVGLCVTSHSDGDLSIGTFENVEFQREAHIGDWSVY
jgi:hypothetical protein